MRSDTGKAPTGWAEARWGDLIELRYGKALGERKTASGIAEVYGTNGPTGDHSCEAQGSTPTIVVGRKGAYRSVRWAPGPFWVIDTAYYVEPKAEFDLAWAFRALSTVDINGLDSGSAIPSTRREDVYAVRVNIPPGQEQRRIAWVLDALDQKIDNNRRIAQALDEIAATLFKARFVDFVEHSDLVESEMGAIPREWNVRSLHEVLAVFTRGRAPTYVDEGGTLVLNQKCVRDGRVSFAPARRHDERRRSSEDRRIQPGDVLINSTGVGTLGRVSQVRWLPEPTTIDSHVTLARAADAEIDQDYLAVSMMGRESDLERMGHGSTGQTELTRSSLGELPVLVPPLEQQRKFSQFYIPIREQARALDQQTIVLSDIRDSLLPKLVSGALRLDGPGSQKDST